MLVVNGYQPAHANDLIRPGLPYVKMTVLGQEYYYNDPDMWNLIYQEKTVFRTGMTQNLPIDWDREATLQPDTL